MVERHKGVTDTWREEQNCVLVLFLNWIKFGSRLKAHSQLMFCVHWAAATLKFPHWGMNEGSRLISSVFPRSTCTCVSTALRGNSATLCGSSSSFRSTPWTPGSACSSSPTTSTMCTSTLSGTVTRVRTWSCLCAVEFSSLVPLTQQTNTNQWTVFRNSSCLKSPWSNWSHSPWWRRQSE